MSNDGSDGNAIISENTETRWTSLVRDDAQEVTIVLTMPPSRINRIILLDHNLRSFSISGNYVNLTDIGNNSIPSIEITNNTSKTNYFAFDEVLITSITLTFGATISPGELKTAKRIILCKEFGTLEGWPVISALSFSDNARTFKSKAGEQLISKQRRTLEKLSLHFKDYAKPKDIELMHELHRTDFPILIWPCGGKDSNFRFLQEGIRLQDIYKVKSKGKIGPKLKNGSYHSLLDSRISFHEVI